MSFTRDITIWCDAADCMEWVSGDPLARTVPQARRHARALGWRYTEENGDLCPDHKEPE